MGKEQKGEKEEKFDYFRQKRKKVVLNNTTKRCYQNPQTDFLE